MFFYAPSRAEGQRVISVGGVHVEASFATSRVVAAMVQKLIFFIIIFFLFFFFLSLFQVVRASSFGKRLYFIFWQVHSEVWRRPVNYPGVTTANESQCIYFIKPSLKGFYLFTRYFLSDFDIVSALLSVAVCQQIESDVCLQSSHVNHEAWRYNRGINNVGNVLCMSNSNWIHWISQTQMGFGSAAEITSPDTRMFLHPSKAN